MALASDMAPSQKALVFDKYHMIDVGSQTELIVSLEIKTKKNADGLPDLAHFSERYENVPEVYYFVTKFKNWNTMIEEGSCQSYLYNLEGKRFYRLLPGRKVCLQTFTGFRICFLTNSNNLGMSTKYYEVKYAFEAYDPQKKCDDTCRSNFFFLLNAITKQPDESTFATPIVPRSHNIHKISAANVHYFLNFEYVSYQSHVCNRKLPIRPMPSLNWTYPKLLRLVQLLEKKEAPRILVMGPTNSGKKHTLTTIMNCGQKNGRPPLLIDIDVGQGCIGVSGTVGLGKIVNQFSVDQEPGRECIFADGYPKLIHFGHTTPEKNRSIYTNALDCLVSLEKDAREKATDGADNYHGVLVNTHSWVEEFGYNSMMQFILKLKVDHIFVHLDKALHEMVFKELFGFDYCLYKKAKRDPNELALLLAQKLQPKTGMSKLLDPANVVFVHSNRFEKPISGSLRYHLRKDRFANHSITGCVSVTQEIEWQDIYYLPTWDTMATNQADDSVDCKGVNSEGRPLYVKLAQCRKDPVVAQALKNRLVSVMMRSIEEVMECCQADNEKNIPIKELLQIKDLFAIQEVLTDSPDYKLIVHVPSYLVQGLQNKAYFLMLHGDTVFK